MDCMHLHVQAVSAKDSSLSKFRSALKSAFSSNPIQFVAANYNRCALNQTQGSGHHSPIGAYDEKTDEIYVLDVHYSVYPPQWFPLELFWKAVVGGPDQCNPNPR